MCTDEGRQPLELLALALHEVELGERCKARGNERVKHVNAYLPTAALIADDLAVHRALANTTMEAE